MFRAMVLGALLVQPALKPTLWTDAIPPDRFQVTGTVILHTLPSSEIAAICDPSKAVPKDMEVLGCSVPENQEMFLPDPCPYARRGDAYARLMCHELAHTLAGWPETHGP